MDEMSGPTSIDDKLEMMCKAIEVLIEKVEEIEAKAERVERLVEDDLFGGIKSLYDQNQRHMGVEDLRGKYGDLFAPHMDSIKLLEPDTDIFEKLYDLLDELKAEDGYSDEVGDSRIKEIASSIGDMIAKLKGEQQAEEAAEGEAPKGEESTEVKTEPEGGAVEIKKVSVRPDADQNLLGRVAAMRDKASAMARKRK